MLQTIWLAALLTGAAQGDDMAEKNREVVRTIWVSLASDVLDEDDETFTLGLSAPANAVIAPPDATVTITDDDATPTVAFTAATQTVSEGAVTATIIAHLSAHSGRPVTLPYSVGTSTATAADYSLAPTGPLSFAPGNTVPPKAPR